jgi:hypothetical protein
MVSLRKCKVHCSATAHDGEGQQRQKWRSIAVTCIKERMRPLVQRLGDPPSSRPTWPLRVAAAKSRVRHEMTICNEKLAC